MARYDLVLLAMAVAAHAQLLESNDAPRIQTCEQLTCMDLNYTYGSRDWRSRAPCYNDGVRATGVGIVSDVFAGPDDTKLSLTLVDDGHEGGVNTGYQQSLQRLLIGAPPDLDIIDQPPACAVMLQYQGQTFPTPKAFSHYNSSSCGSVLAGPCAQTMIEVIQNFEYFEPATGSNVTSVIRRGRCALLADHIRAYYLGIGLLCGRESSLVNYTSSAYLGPDAPSYPAQPQREGCQPVLPQEYELYEVATMRQVFLREEYDQVRGPLRGAGRQGVTPIISVQYSNDETSRPRVEFSCMRTFTPTGEVLPNELNFPNGGARTSAGAMGIIAVMALIMQLL